MISSKTRLLAPGLIGGIVTAVLSLPLGNICGLTVLVGGFVAGLLPKYIYKEEKRLDLTDGLLAGAISGAVAGVVSLILAAVTTAFAAVILGLVGFGFLVALFNNIIAALLGTVLGAAVGIVGLVVLAIANLVFHIIMGALGGAIASAMYVNGGEEKIAAKPS